MIPTLSILIPSLISRTEQFQYLKHELDKQIIHEDAKGKVDVIADIDAGQRSTGEKRNKLLKCATGKYVCFIDDDDKIPSNYIKLVLKGCEEDKDCCSLRGVITWDGSKPEVFEHSLKYDEWRTNDTGVPKYERPPNHLNCIKSIIAKQFKFEEIYHGEDRKWSEAIFKSGLIKTEAVIPEIIYHYQFVTSK